MKTCDKIYYLPFLGESIEVKVRLCNYCVDNSLAATLMCKPDYLEENELTEIENNGEDPFFETFGDITVHLPDSSSLPGNEQFIDTNNFPSIGEWLKSNKIATPTGVVSISGFHQYPSYRFKTE